MKNQYVTWDWEKPRSAREYLRNNRHRRAVQRARIDRFTNWLLGLSVAFLYVVVVFYALVLIWRY